MAQLSSLPLVLVCCNRQPAAPHFSSNRMATSTKKMPVTMLSGFLGAGEQIEHPAPQHAVAKL